MKDKIAVITGGSPGIDRNTTVSLARRGVNVILHISLESNRGGSFPAKPKRCEGKPQASVSTPVTLLLWTVSWSTFARRSRVGACDRFDYLVNRAGTALHAGSEQTTETDFDQIVKVHFKWVFLLTQKLLPLMTDGGRIVNISPSGLTRFTIAGVFAYTAAKRAVEVLTLYLARELGPRGITAKTAVPGCHCNRLQRWMVGGQSRGQ